MSLRSQSMRIGRVFAKDLTSKSTVERGLSSGWRHSNRTVATWSTGSGVPSFDDFSSIRKFSTKPETEASESTSAPEGEAPPAADASENANDDATMPAPETEKIAELEQQVKDLKDNLLRSLAEQENTRRIAKRDVEQARSFAISSFAKSLLDTSDNLSRALDAVPEDLRHDHDNHPVLANLYEGITMTDDGLTKAFAKNKLIKFGAVGEKFDPNKHEALFEYPDPNVEAGNIGQVMKTGFSLNDRVIRPAEVGVVKAP